jgi:hypothetical protein
VRVGKLAPNSQGAVESTNTLSTLLSRICRSGRLPVSIAYTRLTQTRLFTAQSCSRDAEAAALFDLARRSGHEVCTAACPPSEALDDRDGSP